jgi:hypothetical protein
MLSPRSLNSIHSLPIIKRLQHNALLVALILPYFQFFLVPTVQVRELPRIPGTPAFARAGYRSNIFDGALTHSPAVDGNQGCIGRIPFARSSHELFEDSPGY